MTLRGTTRIATAAKTSMAPSRPTVAASISCPPVSAMIDIVPSVGKMTLSISSPACRQRRRNVQFQAYLPCDRTASEVARTTLDGCMAEPDDHERSDALRLATSELVSNAVRHSGCGPGEHIRLLVDVKADLVRVEVEQSTSTSGIAIAERLD